MRMLRIKHVCERVSVSKSTIWQWVKDGKFPPPIKLSSRCTVWLESDLDNWITNAVGQ